MTDEIRAIRDYIEALEDQVEGARIEDSLMLALRKEADMALNKLATGTDKLP